MKERVGFIGLGLMGHGMAKNIVEKGFALDRGRPSQARAGRRPQARGANEAKERARRSPRQATSS